MKARALAALLLAGSQKTLAADAETPPHIAFVLVDDLGFNDAWANSTDLGGAWPRTAALAAEGVALAVTFGPNVGASMKRSGSTARDPCSRSRTPRHLFLWPQKYSPL